MEWTGKCVRLFAGCFGPTSRPIIACCIITYLFVTVALKPVFFEQPPVDELTWVERSLILDWIPDPNVICGSAQPVRGSGWRYYFCIHHPTVARLAYRVVLRSAGFCDPPAKRYNDRITYDENCRLGNILPVQMRELLRATNAAFVLAALVLAYFALLQVCPSRFLALLALLPIVYEPSITGAFNSTVGYIGTDAILLFMLVLFLFAWLHMGDRGPGSAVVLGILGGLAASTKYNGVLAPLAAMAYFAVRQTGWRRVTRPLVTGAVAAAVFVALNPIYLAGGPAWAWKVFGDTLRVLSAGQKPEALQGMTVNGFSERLLLMFPDVVFLLPVVVLMSGVWRSRGLLQVIFWAAFLMGGNLIALRLFLPTYAAPVRLAFLLALMAAALAKARNLFGRQDSPGGASSRPDQPPALTAAPGPSLVSRGTARILDAVNRVPARVRWLLLVPIPLGAFFLEASSWMLVPTLLVCLFIGGYWVLRSAAAAALVALPLALTVPWRYHAAVQFMAPFCIAASICWLISLYFASPRHGPHASTVLTAAMTAALALAPQSLPLVALVIGCYLARPTDVARRVVVRACLVSAGVAFGVRALLLLVFGAGVSSMLSIESFFPSHPGVWSLAALSESSHSRFYNANVRLLNQDFCWALLVPLALLAYPCRRQWWFTPTFAGGMLLFVATYALGKSAAFQYSLPMQVGLLVPFGIVAAGALHRELRARRAAVYPPPEPAEGASRAD